MPSPLIYLAATHELPQQTTSERFLRYCVAVISAWTAETITYPLDLTKTRLQIQSEVASAKEGFKLEKKGMVQTAVGIAKKEGVLKLWSGLLPMLHRHAIYAGSKLVIYEKYRYIMRDENGKLSLAYSCLGGVLAGAMGQWLASPTDLIKVQMQAEGRRLLQGKEPRFKNCRQAYAKIYAESGILGFWRGAVPNAQRAALVNLGQLTAYDYTKRSLMSEFGMADDIVLHAISAFIAGFLAAAFGTPADVMKTRLMNQPLGKDGKGLLYKGMIDCFRQSVMNEGILSLYKGFLPLWIRLGPWSLINWVIFEQIMVALGGRSF